MKFVFLCHYMTDEGREGIYSDTPKRMETEGRRVSGC